MLDGQAEPIAHETSSGLTIVLQSLLSLLRQLGPDLILTKGKYFIPYDVDLEKWAKVQAYAATVATVRLRATEPALPDNTYVAMSRLQGRDVLFSKSRQLEIDFKWMHAAFDITFALSPSLSDIKLLGPTEESQFQTSFYLTSHHFGSLSRLLIRDCQLESRLLIALSTSCQLLEEVELKGIWGQLQYQHLQPLLALPFLQCFSFSSLQQLAYERELDDQSEGIETDLRPHHLSIETDSTLALTTDLLKAARKYRCNVHSLALNLPESPPSAELRKLFQLCPKSINIVTLAGMYGTELWKDMIPEAVQALDHLHKLTFPPNCMLAPPSQWDTQLLTYLPSWSTLESLVLPYGKFEWSSYNGYYREDSSQGISLGTLKAVAQGCPNLLSLQAFVQLPSTFEPPGGYSDCFVGHHLSDLTLVSHCIQRVPPDAPAIHSMARFIYSLFPHIERIKTETHPDSRATPHWQPIAAMVMLLKSVCEEQFRLSNIHSRK